LLLTCTAGPQLLIENVARHQGAIGHFGILQLLIFLKIL